jgi:energy-coupling factor transporter ATP-binding protein EcfA2
MASPKQALIVLCGLPGSGKSTSARVMQGALGGEVVCQDDRGNREACMSACRDALWKRKLGVVMIDRVNFSMSQRGPWIQIARELDASDGAAEEEKESMSEMERLQRQKEAMQASLQRNNNQSKLQQPDDSDVLCIAIVIDVGVDTCISRVKDRADHPTLGPDKADPAIRNFASQWHAPKRSEGFSEVLVVRSEGDLRSAISRIQRLRASKTLRTAGARESSWGARARRYQRRERGRGGSVWMAKGDHSDRIVGE